MSRPELWIVAGPNGAGKTTLVNGAPIHALLQHVVFLNPDDIALASLQARGLYGFQDAPDAILNEAFRAAADEVLMRLIAQLEEGRAVGVETVLSSQKYEPLVESLLQRGGFLGLIYVWVESPEMACARVERRVAGGGHDVPRKKTVARWHRSLENLAWFLPRASRFWIYDNSNSDPAVAPRLLALGGQGTTEFVARPLDPRLTRVLPPLAGA